MLVDKFASFGGAHAETAAMKNLLAHAGVVSPLTGAPLSEAMCLGIAGGIAAGYSFCPSVPEDNAGSGVSVVGRYKAYATGPDYYQGFFSKLKISTHILETTSERTAYRNLLETLQSGHPAVVWSAPMLLSYNAHPCTSGMYSCIVYGVDSDREVALVSDRAPNAWEVDLETLAAARKKVCSHKNRLLYIGTPSYLSVELLRSAVIAGVQECVRDLMVPKIKTYNLPGLLEWSRIINSTRNKKGWQVVYSDGNFYPALRDVYDSIETGGTGGGLFRPLYAQFLDEAAVLTGKKTLHACAELYRRLGVRWQEVAGSFLDDTIPEFARTKELLNQRRSLLENEGFSAHARLQEILNELTDIDTRMLDEFPLSDKASVRLLNKLAEELEGVYEAEMDAAEALERAMR